MTLYEIDAGLRHLLAKVVAADGEVTPEDELEFDQLNLQRHDKLGGCASVIRSLELDIQKVETELKRLEALKKRYASHLQRVTILMKRSLGEGGSWTNGIFHAGWRKSSAVELEPGLDVKSLPERFIRFKETYEANKPEIRRAIESGETVEGAKLVDRLNFFLE